MAPRYTGMINWVGLLANNGRRRLAITREKERSQSMAPRESSGLSPFRGQPQVVTSQLHCRAANSCRIRVCTDSFVNPTSPTHKRGKTSPGVAGEFAVQRILSCGWTEFSRIPLRRELSGLMGHLLRKDFTCSP